MNNIQKQVSLALAEDIGSGDITAALCGSERMAHATIVTRETAVLCGTAWVDEVFLQVDEDIKVTWLASEGEVVDAQQILCEIHGNARAIVTGERTALNFLQLLSGIATTVQRYSQALSTSKTQLLDTRKTLPCLRALQKYAVRVGGGYNHRAGLYDAILIKENHLALAQESISTMLQRARQLYPDKKIEIEVENLTQLQEAIAGKPDVIMLDNFTIQQMQQAVNINAGRVKLEVSGGVTLENMQMIAATGIDYISVGKLTKDIQSIDLSLRIVSLNSV